MVSGEWSMPARLNPFRRGEWLMQYFVRRETSDVRQGIIGTLSHLVIK